MQIRGALSQKRRVISHYKLGFGGLRSGRLLAHLEPDRGKSGLGSDRRPRKRGNAPRGGDPFRPRKRGSAPGAFKSSQNAFMLMANALWFIFVLIAGRKVKGRE